MIAGIEHGIAELTEAQHGVVTRRQLLSAGLTPKMVASRVASKRLVPLHRGVYLLGRAAARAERRGLLTDGDLAAVVTRHAGRRGVPRLRVAFSADRPRVYTRSEAEERFLDLVQSGGLPSLTASVMIEGYEVDFLWPRAKLVVEVDGYAYHASRRSFESDRRRDAELQAAGYQVVRVTWRQLVEERDATLVRLARALALARAGP